MQIQNFQTLRRFAADKLQKLPIFGTPRFFMDVYCLESGQSQRPHAHDDADKVYAVLEGRVEVEIGGERRPLGPGEAALAPAGQVHGLHNVSGERAAVLVFMTRAAAE